MKRRIIRVAALTLVVCMIMSASLVGCSSKGKTLVSLDEYEISTNIYQLMLSQQKGSMANAIYSQYRDYNSETFWGMTIDMSTQMTNEDYYNDAVLEKAKNFLCAMKLYPFIGSIQSHFITIQITLRLNIC